MFKNYLSVAIRNQLKDKWYVAMNIFGLVIGMTCYLMIFIFINNEMSYDSFHENRKKIYRFGQYFDGSPFGGAPAPLGPAFRQDFPEIIDCVRMYKTNGINIRYGDKVFFENKFFMTDASFFNIFTFPLIKGDPETVLQNPNSIVLTNEIAEKYFGSEDPIGKILIYDNEIEFTVTGITENNPPNSHLYFNALVSFENQERILGADYRERWGASNFVTYFLFADNVSPKSLKEKVVKNAAKYPWRKKQTETIYFEKLEEIHLTTNRMDFEPAFEKKYILLLGTAGLTILLIACINFINLTTARSTNRAKEVGLRKVVGAAKSDLVKQFLAESMVVSTVSLLISVFVSIAVIEWISKISGTIIDIAYVELETVILLVISVIFIGLITGIYPSLYISSFQPSIVLKSGLKKSKTNPIFRNFLVVFQFILSVTLIVVTLTIRSQIDYIKNKDLGWDKNYLINISLNDTAIRENYESFKNELLKIPEVLNASASIFKPNQVKNRHGGRWAGKQDDKIFWIWIMYVDYDFIDTFDLEVVEGRGFNKELLTDVRSSYIFNEEAVKKIGWENPIGKSFTAFGEDSYGPVIGVVKNFHFRSFHHEVEPALLYINPVRLNNLAVKLRETNLPETIKKIESVWKEFAPGISFEFSYLDDHIEMQYENETTMNRIIGLFSWLSLIIASIGLFNLAAFMIENRKKEIGVRKVLGASVSSVVLLFLKQFIKCVLIALVISWPLSFFMMHNWLQDFAYHISLSWSILLYSGLLVLGAAVLTVSFITLKAGMANPADVLKRN